MKIKNEKLAGQEVLFSCGLVLFDETGIGEIEDAEFAKSVLEIKGFEEVPTEDKTIEDKTTEDKTTEDKEETKEPPKEEKKTTKK